MGACGSYLRRAGAGPGRALETEAVAAAIAPKIARFKQPKALFVVDELPRNTMGKVQKNQLRDRYKEVFSVVRAG